jgi:hypothetical protein
LGKAMSEAAENDTGTSSSNESMVLSKRRSVRGSTHLWQPRPRHLALLPRPVTPSLRHDRSYERFTSVSACSLFVIITPPRTTAAQPNLVSLSLIGTSLPVVLLYLLRMKSEICSSFACSTALSLSCLPWPRNLSCTKSTPRSEAISL